MSEDHSDAIARIEAKVNDLHRVVVGPPDEMSKGVVLRLDRLEQKMRLAGWLSAAAITASLGALARVVFKAQ